HSLVPVDHEPDFGDVSFVPVDHDPFGADGLSLPAGTHPKGQPQPPAPDAGQLDAEAPAVGVVAPKSSPEKPTIDWSRGTRPFGELKPVTFPPTQRFGYLVADGLMGLGMNPYNANRLTSRVGNLLGLTPLGFPGAVADFIDAKQRDDLPGAAI